MYPAPLQPIILCPMPITDDILARARKLDSRAAEQVAASSYPSTIRIARALTGREKVAAAVAERVLRQSVQFMPKWSAGTVPENWYYHHTVLTARQAVQRTGPPATAQDDLLATAAGPADIPYAAFIRALRGLPVQQAEAFILNHGERLNERLLGVAMDCSAVAAANHLRAADGALAAVAGPDFEAMNTLLSKNYAALTPPEPAVKAEIRSAVSAVLWPRRVKRIVVWLLVTCVLAAAAYAAWRWRDQLPTLRERLGI